MNRAPNHDIRVRRHVAIDPQAFSENVPLFILGVFAGGKRRPARGRRRDRRLFSDRRRIAGNLVATGKQIERIHQVPQLSENLSAFRKRQLCASSRSDPAYFPIHNSLVFSRIRPAIGPNPSSDRSDSYGNSNHSRTKIKRYDGRISLLDRKSSNRPIPARSVITTLHPPPALHRHAPSPRLRPTSEGGPPRRDSRSPRPFCRFSRTIPPASGAIPTRTDMVTPLMSVRAQRTQHFDRFPVARFGSGIVVKAKLV